MHNRIYYMLQNFHSRYRNTFTNLSIIFKPTGQRIFTILIRPVKIKAIIPHQPGQHSIATSRV
ncbi:hypothetical protein PSEUDO8O_20122 [Pseudomonas sp. 8O]|nr:hypothetical protein PSEUDO8O_20122 [Pseudomonas sp. 8O]